MREEEEEPFLQYRSCPCSELEIENGDRIIVEEEEEEKEEQSLGLARPFLSHSLVSPHIFMGFFLFLFNFFLIFLIFLIKKILAN